MIILICLKSQRLPFPTTTTTKTSTKEKGEWKDKKPAHLTTSWCYPVKLYQLRMLSICLLDVNLPQSNGFDNKIVKIY